MAVKMQLKSLDLTNFHQFKHFSIDFDERLTVLVGNNGTGKSSILEAASIAIGCFCASFGVVRSEIKRNDARVELHDLSGYSDRQEQYPVTVSAAGIVGDGEVATSTKWSQSLLSSEGNMDNNWSDPIIRFSDECHQRVQSGDNGLILPILAYYGTGRLWGSSKNGISNRRRTFSRFDGYKGAFDARTDKEQMLSWFFKMAVQDVQRAQSLKPSGESPVYVAVRKAVELSFKAITGANQVNVTYNLDADDLDFEYITKSGDLERMLLGNLSDGYRTTLSMFADIAYRMALLNPMLGEEVLSTPGIVLIDEIDLHLHPLWQARILGDLRSIFPEVQFIVTTHALTVISSVAAKHIRILKGGETADKLKGEILGSDVGRVLISVMDAPERPVQIQKLFDEFYDLLDKGDLVQARGLLSDIESQIGSDDTELVSATTALALEEADTSYVAD